ncbi:MAG: MAPEG family protein [Pseudomonadota bacterium]
MPLTVTAIYAGVLTLWIIYLAWLIGQARRKHKVSLGDGNVPELTQLCRAHGNAIETIPLALVLMALAETLGAPGAALHPLGLLLVVGRVVHGVYFFRGARELRLRVLGMMATVTVLGVLAFGLLAHGIGQLIGGA